MVMCDRFPLRIGRNLYPNLEIPLVALTELDLDRHLTPRFSDRCGNVLRTTYNDCWPGPMNCRNRSGNRNKHYALHHVFGVNNPTLGLDRLLVA